MPDRTVPRLRTDWLLLVSLCAAVAWTSRSGRSSTSASAAPQDPAGRLIGAPSFARVTIAGLDSVAPTRSPATVAVSSNGTLALLGVGDPEHRLVTVIDSTGKVLSRFGKQGKGSNDITAPQGLRFVGDTLLVYDVVLNRILATRASGKHVFTRDLPDGVRLLRMGADSVDVELRPWTLAASVRRISLETGGGRDLISGTDTTFSTAALWLWKQGKTPGFALGGDADQILVGEGYRYRLLLYSARGELLGTGGRDLPYRTRTDLEMQSILRVMSKPPAAGAADGAFLPPPSVRARFAKDTLSHFSFVAGIQRDGRGRYLVIGELHDSTFVDAFDGVRFLGRTMFACRAPGDGISVNGNWMALECLRVGTQDDRDVETQLYRLVDGASPGA
jgi:hypothetical protein